MAVATTAKMSCERCGQQVIAADGLCEACVEWSRGAGGLSEKDVVEAVQFSGSPVASSDRVVAAIGISAGAAALSLFIVVYPLLDTYALVSSGGRLVESHRPQLLALLVTFLAALLSGVSSVGCALVGRRRPLTAAIIAAVVVAVLTIPVIVVTANNEEFMFL